MRPRSRKAVYDLIKTINKGLPLGLYSVTQSELAVTMAADHDGLAVGVGQQPCRLAQVLGQGGDGEQHQGGVQSAELIFL